MTNAPDIQQSRCTEVSQSVAVCNRRDVDLEAKLLQRLQQAQKSSVEQRFALLEASLAQGLDSSLACQSGLVQRLSLGLRDLRYSINQDKSYQVTQPCMQPVVASAMLQKFGHVQSVPSCNLVHCAFCP